MTSDPRANRRRDGDQVEQRPVPGRDDRPSWVKRRPATGKLTPRQPGKPTPALSPLRVHGEPLPALQGTPVLPEQPAPLLGREREIAAARKLLLGNGTRLVTLTGAGGTGKTRLALAVATTLLDHFPDGVFFIDLAPLSTPDLVAPAIARELAVGETAGQSLHTALQMALRQRRCLLILDNFEQVLPAAPLVADLLAACPALAILVTSRAALHLRWEHDVPVPPLPTPDLRALPDLPTLATMPAIALFVDRARAVNPAFALTAANAAAIAEICVRLDGLPLAIELAAARIAVFPPQALLTRLQRRLDVLTGGQRDLPARHRTLRETIGWSYYLLTERERALLRGLALFTGGCTFDAVEAIARAMSVESDKTSPLDDLTSLIDKSLLSMNEAANGEPRYFMLETIREFALEQLVAGGELPATRRQYSAHFLALAEAAAEGLCGPEQAAWLDCLELEHDNLRAILRWSVADDRAGAASGVETGLRIGGALWRFWYARGHATEGRRWLTNLLAQPAVATPTAARATALNSLANLASKQGDYAAARAAFAESLAIRRASGDRREITASLNNLGFVTYQLGDYAAARILFEESLALGREIGYDQVIAFALSNLGQLAYDAGDYPLARALYEESLALGERTGDEGSIAMSLAVLGQVALAEGDVALAHDRYTTGLARARAVGARRSTIIALTGLGNIACGESRFTEAHAYFTESLAIAREGENRHGIVTTLEGFARLAAAQRQPERALRLAGAAARLRETIGARASPAEQTSSCRALEPAWRALNRATGTRLYDEGQALSFDQAIDYALIAVAPVAAPPARLKDLTHHAPTPARQKDRERVLATLTRREREVAMLIMHGLTNRQIAAELSIAERTVDTHVANILGKLGFATRAQVAAWATEHGLARPA